MLAIVEYASIRLMLVCEIAMILPAIIDSSERISSIPCQSNAIAASDPTRSRVMKPNAASFGAAPTNRVIAVGAPSYTSGSHMWYGTAPSLKAMAETTNTRPKASIVF